MQLDGPAIAAIHLRRLLERDGWLVFYTHDVAERPSPFGCHPALIQDLCERAMKGGADVLPVSCVEEPVGQPCAGEPPKPGRPD